MPRASVVLPAPELAGEIDDHARSADTGATWAPERERVGFGGEEVGRGTLGHRAIMIEWPRA